MAGVVDAQRVRALARQQTLERVTDPAPVTVDAGVMVQVVENLVSDAEKY